MNTFILTEWPSDDPNAVTAQTETYKARIAEEVDAVLAVRKQTVDVRIKPAVAKVQAIERAAAEYAKSVEALKGAPRMDADLTRTIVEADRAAEQLSSLSRFVPIFTALQERLSCDYLTLAIIGPTSAAGTRLISRFNDIGAEEAGTVPVTSKLQLIEAPTDFTDADLLLLYVASAEELETALKTPAVKQFLARNAERSALTLNVAVDVAAAVENQPSQKTITAGSAVHAAVTKTKIPYASLNEVDSSDGEALDNYVMSLVAKLSTNVRAIDSASVTEHLSEFRQVQADSLRTLLDLDTLLLTQTSQSVSGDIDDDRLRLKYNELAASVDYAVGGLTDRSEEIDDELKRALISMAAALDANKAALLPTLRDVEGVSAVYGSLGAYTFFEKRQRAAISSYFRSLQRAGNETIQSGKFAVVAALQSAFSNRISFGTNPAEFLTTLIERFGSTANSSVAQEIRELRDAALDLSSVDDALYRLISPSRETAGSVDVSDAASIYAALAVGLSTAASTIQDAISKDDPIVVDLLKLPNRLASSRGRRFRDAAFFAPGSYSLWAGLLRKYRRDVWGDDVNQLQNLNEQLQAVRLLLEETA